jgi:hypothetical protein
MYPIKYFGILTHVILFSLQSYNNELMNVRCNKYAKEIINQNDCSITTLPLCRKFRIRFL